MIYEYLIDRDIEKHLADLKKEKGSKKKMLSSIERYLSAHAATINAAERSIRRRMFNSEPMTLGDIAFDVASWSRYETKEYQARIIISHAAKNGAFGNIRLKRGQGFIMISEKQKTKKKKKKRAA